MTVLVNGEPRTAAASRTVADLVDELGLPGPALLIEHNGIALTRSEWAAAPLDEGDRIELLHVAAGG